MALLDRRARALPALALAVLVAALGGLAACTSEAPPLPDDGPGFSHRDHVVTQGLDCAVCHEARVEPGSLLAGEPVLPSSQVCDLCHASLDVGKPVDATAASFFQDDRYLGSRPHEAYGDEIIFSHRSHLDQVTDCGRCHPGVERSHRVAEVPRLGMDDCTSCHEQNEVPPGCETCHTELGIDVPPSSHGQLWTQAHGSAWRNPSDAIEDRCEMCHTETSCISCHKAEMPASHTNAFRLRLHGMDAAFDRQACQVCHTDDSCERCHSVTEPLSHVGGWGQRQNTHCLGCHFPLGNESCAVCHRATPSHNDATPLPPDHDPAFNCRNCHGAGGAPLPHVDDGSSCTACHMP